MMRHIENKINDNKIFWWGIAIFTGILMRFIVLYFTDNFDFRAVYNTGSLAASGKNVYANTEYYNYGPILFMIVGRLYKLASYFANNVLAFKIMYVGVLTIADLFIAMLLTKKSGSLWGMLFFVNPISAIIDGYHTQFDNIAIAFGAYGIFCVENSSQDSKFKAVDVAGVVLLSLSLMTKHILWAFPIYVLLADKINVRKKMLYAFVPPLIFLMGFVPYWAEGSRGIIQNVFMYRSFKNFPLIGRGLIRQFGISIDINVNETIFLLLFFVLIAISAYVFRRESVKNLFLLYTTSVVCFSSGASGQQLVIPCMAMIMIFRERSIFYFTLIITRLMGKQIMLFAMSWCLLFYLVYYYRKKQA